MSMIRRKLNFDFYYVQTQVHFFQTIHIISLNPMIDDIVDQDRKIQSKYAQKNNKIFHYLKIII